MDLIHNTETLADGRQEVAVILFDSFEDPRDTDESPAVAGLIAALEGSGWQVAHMRRRFASQLTVSEVVSDAPMEG